MSAISVLNSKAEFARAQQALAINITASRGLQDVLKSNLGPKGTLKMLVSGAGDIKLTKDGCVLLNEMQIQHPTASLIARVATAQDDMTGDGTTSTVLLIGELLKLSEDHVAEGLHPRHLTEGFEIAKEKALAVLEQIKIPVTPADRDLLLSVARTSLKTKVHAALAELLTEAVTDAVLAIRQEGAELDLNRVEIMQMMHKTDMDSKLVRGLVLDHGVRHPDMPKRVENAFILVANVSLEYEKTEVNSGFFYKSAAEREKLVLAEREFITQRVQRIIAFKESVCSGANAGRAFVLINQKGVDPYSLDLLAKAGIPSLRRAKRRNMERIALACGGYAVNSVDDLAPDCLGEAGLVYEYTLGEESTPSEECKRPQSLLCFRGPNKYTLTQIKDAAVRNAINDGCAVPGAGAFEVAASRSLTRAAESVAGRARLGVQTFADALLVLKVMVKLLEESQRSGGAAVGLDLATGEACLPADAGVLDNHCVKKQIVNSVSVIAANLLLVDEILRAGLSSLKGE
uniref:T-complex protein 1 subunit zeta n=1 Tax=Macrostomum lignano TaxID=282301 RepID=A0A1I8FVU4_9PLAT